MVKTGVQMMIHLIHHLLIQLMLGKREIMQGPDLLFGYLRCNMQILSDLLTHNELDSTIFFFFSIFLKTQHFS